MELAARRGRILSPRSTVDRCLPGMCRAIGASLGRPTNALRRVLSDLVDKHGMGRLEAYPQGDDAGAFFRAMELALKYGVGTKLDVDTPANPWW